MSSCFTCLWTSITCYVNISKIQQKLQVNLRNWLRVPGVPRVLPVCCSPYVWSLHQLTLSHSKYQMVPDGSLRQRHGWRNAFIWILARHEAYVLLLAEDILPMQLEKLTLKQILVTCRTFQTNLCFCPDGILWQCLTIDMVIMACWKLVSVGQQGWESKILHISPNSVKYDTGDN